MTNTILNGLPLHDDDFDIDGDPIEPVEELSATIESDPSSQVEFHVQMRDWTIRNMEKMIVEAAARIIVGRHGDNQLARQIEARCVELITEKIDSHLIDVTDSIIDEPLTPSFNDKKPITMREFIGLYPHEYLRQRVDSSGNPSPGGWNPGSKQRVEYLVERALDAKFKRDIDAATASAITAIQASIKEQHKAVLDEQKARLAAAMAKMVAP